MPPYIVLCGWSVGEDKLVTRRRHRAIAFPAEPFEAEVFGFWRNSTFLEGNYDRPLSLSSIGSLVLLTFTLLFLTTWQMICID
jgi:hypothetical protein